MSSRAHQYGLNPLLVPKHSISGALEIPPKVLTLVILHSLDVAFAFLNILFTPLAYFVDEPSLTKWNLSDQLFAFIMGVLGWGWVTEREIEDLIGRGESGYQRPRSGDSRSPCPAINALANTGYIPRNGKNVSLTLIALGLRRHYDFAPTFAFQLTVAVSFICTQSGDGKTWFNLSDIACPNLVEHDASLVRDDRALQPDQGNPNIPLIDRLLSFAVEKSYAPVPVLTYTTIAKAMFERRVICSSKDDPEKDRKVRNGQYTLNPGQAIFGAGNAAIMIISFGGRVDQLNVWLKEERFPYELDWSPYNRPEDPLPRGLFGITFLRHLSAFSYIEAACRACYRVKDGSVRKNL